MPSTLLRVESIKDPVVLVVEVVTVVESRVLVPRVLHAVYDVQSIAARARVCVISEASGTRRSGSMPGTRGSSNYASLSKQSQPCLLFGSIDAEILIFFHIFLHFRIDHQLALLEL